MKMLKKKNGFTLLELLIVLVIIGVLAGLMFPVMTQQIEKSRGQEALTALGTVKEAEVRYFNFNSTYTDNATLLGYNPNTVAGGQTPNFVYTFSGASATGFQCQATTSRATGSLTITQQGDVVRTGVYA